MARNSVAAVAAELAHIGSTRDAKQFLEDMLACEDLSLNMRAMAAQALLPYQYPKLHAVWANQTTDSVTFEAWLDRLTDEQKRLMEDGRQRLIEAGDD